MISFLVNLVTQVAGFVRTVIVELFVPGPPSPVAQQRQRKSFSADVLRADDLLVLRLDFYNLRISIGAGSPGGKQLVTDGAGDSFVVAWFPPQHVGEQAFAEDNANDPLLPPPVAARLAGESRLVFHLNPALLPLDFKLETLLDALSRSAPLVADRIRQPPLDPAIGTETDFGGWRSQFSAIEAPWRLFLSPHPDGRWMHSAEPVRDGTRTELWHTRLGVKPKSGTRVDEQSTAKRTARAVFSPDYSPANTPAVESDLSPFRTSLRRYHRHYLVRLTADRDLSGNAPVAVERLMLSSLGSWLNVHGEWSKDLTGINLIEWRHRATLGRDQFVKVVLAGFLFPLGHRAVKITITERKLGHADQFEGPQGGIPGPVAYLRQRTFIVVREPVKAYSHREFPFRTVTFTKLTSPNLIDPPDEKIATAADGADIFWPRFQTAGVSQDVLFELEGVDWEGRASSFLAPQIFVPATADDSAAFVNSLVATYNGAAGPIPPVPDVHPRRSRPLGGQKVAFAPPLAPGDTTYETETLILGALNATGTPHFLPAMRGSEVKIPAVRHITGSSAVSLIRFDDGYLGAPPTQFGNAGEVFARIDGPKKIKFPVEKTGGLVAPDLTPQGLSRAFGPVGDVASFAGGSFQPANIFAGIKILGGIELDKIFMKIPFGWPAQAGPKVPGLTTVQTATGFRTRYLWVVDRPEIQGQPIFEPQPGAKFTLDSVIDTPLAGTPSFVVDGRLEKFEIVLPPGKALIAARFDHVRFHAGTNEKVDVSVQFDDLVFKNELSFVDDICRYIPLDGFVDPPYLDVDASGVSAGFTLAIPTIGVGIFVLQDLSLSAGFHLPFIGGAASLRFALCERDHPFLVTVSLFGGGGFFALDLDTKQVTNLEVSIEFGAAVAINLGVAEGKASITGGFYFQKSGAGEQLTAFFRAAGALSVLGIITVSIEIYIGLTFQSKLPNGGTLTGTASVKVKIKIAFFSVSVSVSMHKELAGSDPTFAQMIEPEHWEEYCGAFALEGP
jgi:hypothetical protein